MIIPARVNFCHTLQDWDGFGVNYVEVSQSPDYSKDPQDYGGFGTLSEESRQEIVQMIFGEDGLKPGVFKMFIDCFQQKEENVNGDDPADLQLSRYDHETTTRWMRYFIREGLRITRERGGDLHGVATLYGPPAFMTKIRKVRGRDLDPKYETELAKYIVAFAKYMREREGFPIDYLSIHNEGEDFHRWPEDGLDPNLGTGHDYNLYWTPEHVARFMPLLKTVAEKAGTKFLPTPGECTGWGRFKHWGYADAIAESTDAVNAMGLITSHGFFGDGLCDRWSNPHTGAGIAELRSIRPELHAWVTSTSWKNMDSMFAAELHHGIYDAGVNAIIPWACVQSVKGWVGGDPNPGCAFSVNGDGTYTVQKGYYYYKHFCRAGQPGMKVAAASCAFTPCTVSAFASNGTSCPNTWIVTNTSDTGQTLKVRITGGKTRYHAFRTTAEEHFADCGTVETDGESVTITCPPDSVTSFAEI